MSLRSVVYTVTFLLFHIVFFLINMYNLSRYRNKSHGIRLDQGRKKQRACQKNWKEDARVRGKWKEWREEWDGTG